MFPRLYHRPTATDPPLLYIQTEKHHSPGNERFAQWAPAVTEDEEFMCFETAVVHGIEDGKLNKFGVLPDGPDGLRDLGTCGQQIAKFPRTRDDFPWHGFPLHPIIEGKLNPSFVKNSNPGNDVFTKLLSSKLITKQMKKKLRRGDRV